MKRSFLAIIICISMLLSMIPVVSAETTVVSSGTMGDSAVSYSLDSDGVITFTGTGATPDYTNANLLPYYDYMADIKTVVVESGVTALGDRLFYGASNLTSVSIANTVTDIGEGCFRQCTSLETITLPASLTNITRAAFYKCTALEEIDLGGTVTIGDKVFNSCSSLTKLTIPDSLESLSVTYDNTTSDVFAGIASSGVTVSFGGTAEQWETLLATNTSSAVATQSDTVVTLSDGTIYGETDDDSGDDSGDDSTDVTEVTGTIGEVSWKFTSDGVLTIYGSGSTGDATKNKQPWVEYCAQIKTVVVEEGVTALGARLFYGDTSTTKFTALESISIAGTVTSIGEACFRGCTALKSVTLPDGLYTLTRVAFYGCTALTEVDLGETVTALGDKIFNGCGKVTKLTIPVTLTTLEGGSGTDAFNGISITEVSVTYGGTIEQWKTLLKTYDSVLGKDYVTVTCTDGTYNSADDSGDTGEVTVVCKGTTGDVQYKLTSDGVFTLSGTGKTGDGHSDADGSNPAPWAAYLSQIKTLVVDEGVTLIGNNMFRDAVNLTSVSFPSTLTSIGEACFRDCTSLKSVTLPASLTTLKRVAFFGCTALKEIVIAGTFTQLNDKLFTNCAALQKITIPATVTSLKDSKGTDAFAGVTPTWKNPVTVTYGGTIEQWKALLETYPSTALGKEYVTVVCSDGEYVHTPVDSSISYGPVGQVYWKYDSTTKTLTLGGSGETPADYSNVTGSNPVPWAQFIPEMETLIVEEGVTTVGQNLFRDAKKLTSVSLPNGLKSIGQATFRDCDALLSITVPDTVEVLTRTAFYDCDLLQEVTLGGTYTYLTDKLFQKCVNLRKITIPGTVTYIDSNAFGSCALVNTIYFGGTRAQWSSVMWHSKSTGASAIRKDYIKVYCTDGLYIYGSTNMENGLVYKISDGVLMIQGNGAIADYTAGSAPWSEQASEITAVILYNGITGVGENAFADCANLEVAVYQGDLETLKANISATGNNPLLTAFENSTLSGKCGANATWELDAATGKMTISGTGAIYNYESRKTTPWTNYASLVTELVIEDGITSIGEYAFNSLRNLVTLSLPATLEILDVYCFGICPNLTEVTIPEGVRIIASKVFNTCSGLTTIHLPSTLEYVDMKAFEGATSITDVYYNGSKMDWNAITISINGGGNDYLLNADIHYAVTNADYTDVADSAYAADINYLLNNALAEISGETFGVNETENLELVLVALYNRAGVQRSYADALTWAVECGIVSEGASQELTLQSLSEILFRAACYNVYSDALLHKVDIAGAAAAWCEENGFANGLVSAADTDSSDVLTREQVCSVLAAFLKASSGTVDRYEKIVSTVKSALAAGGDGNMYILPINIHADNDGGGDGTFVLFPDGKTMLIDTFSASDSAVLLSVLEAIGLESLDYMVLSHGHADHIGCAQDVVNWIYGNGGTIGEYWSVGYIYPASTEDDLIALLETKGVTLHTDLRQGNQFTVGEVVIDIYHPTQAALDAVTTDGTYVNELINNVSLVMKFTYGTSTFLTCGDLHSNQEYKLVQSLGDKLQADVTKSNHHGTYTSNSTSWMNAVNPKIVFTHAEDLGEATFYEACLAKNREFYSAGLDGLMVITMDNAANYDVLTQYGAEKVAHLCDPQEVKGTDATCTQPGTMDHYKCECGLLYEDAEGTKLIEDVTISALGHKDENKDHICDNGCGVAQGTHADGDDADHLCDYGCTKVADEGCWDSDDKDHDCDECGQKDIEGHTPGAGADCESDQVCTECGAVLTEKLGHKDENKDHICDNGCGVAQGTHADGDDADHLCDYGCTKVADEGCWDSDDKDHDCDECGQKDIEGHTPGAGADCETDQVCTECGAVLTEKLGHNWQTGSDEEKHWQYCEKCETVKDAKEHSYGENGTCDCGAVKTEASPDTDDSTMIAAFGILMLLSAAGIAVMVEIKRKNGMMSF